MTYYIYDGKIYKTRRELIGRTTKARFYYHDDLYTKCDWLTEPNESLDELYTQRAKQLREEYDYLILMYSGGADSQQVLRSFIDNNLRLEEVHTLYPVRMLRALEGGDGEFPNGYNLSLLKEYNEAVIPRFKQLAITHPHMILKSWDITDHIEKYHLSDNFIQDNYQTFASHNKYRVFQINYQALLIQNYIMKIQGKVGIIYGSEKPLLRIDRNTLYNYFTDLGQPFPHSYQQEHNLIYNPIPFFSDPSCANITIKQCHQFLKLLKNGQPLPHRDSKLFKKILYPTTFEPQFYQQPPDLKHHDEVILEFFYGQKEKDNIKIFDQLKVRSETKLYKVGDFVSRK